MIRDGFDHVRLLNGLQVLGEPTPARSVAVGAMVDTGARDEAPEEAGVSHFLEHLAFKGDGTRDAIALNRAFDAIGARYNAFTSHERTFYYGAVLPESGGELTDLVLSLLRPALTLEDVDVERQVVLEEIAMYHDRPASRAFEQAAARFYAGHPLGASVLGTVESLQGLTPERVRAYHARRYAADKVVVVATGAYDWDALVARVARASEGWSARGAARDYPPLAPRRGAEEVRAGDVARAHLTYLAPAPSSQDPERITAALLARVLGDDDNGRLFWALVEPGLVEDASLWYDAADGSGAFQAYATTDDEAVDAVAEAFDEVLERFEREGPSEDEWARAQRGLATSLTLRAETPMGRLAGLADAWLDRGEVESTATTVARVLATPLAEGRALLETRPFAARFRYALRPERAS
ncbi:MAG: pitrilysin family protein [Trueperaceae bacterium]|nr:pitrilysin family protein [Trueperaceae bacterium]